jgi:hypothetical protein
MLKKKLDKIYIKGLRVLQAKTHKTSSHIFLLFFSLFPTQLHSLKLSLPLIVFSRGKKKEEPFQIIELNGCRKVKRRTRKSDHDETQVFQGFSQSS